jgi:hypothetical protein
MAMPADTVAFRDFLASRRRRRDRTLPTEKPAHREKRDRRFSPVEQLKQAVRGGDRAQSRRESDLNPSARESLWGEARGTHWIDALFETSQ